MTGTISSYERLLAQMNNRRRPLAERTRCECGKEVYTKQLDKHRQTTIHHVLMFKLKKAQEECPQN